MSVRIQSQTPVGMSSALFLGRTIQEKTRSILGWTNEYRPPPVIQCELTTQQRRQIRRKPYSLDNRRTRKNSTSSSSSTCSESSTSSASSPGLQSTALSVDQRQSMDIDQQRPGSSPDCSTPSTIYNSTCRSLRDVQIFERLRLLVPVLPSDRNAYQVLIETVSQVIDLEQQLEQLNEKTADVRNGLRLCGGGPMPLFSTIMSDQFAFPEFPDDLQSVDVTAFKHLIGSAPECSLLQAS